MQRKQRKKLEQEDKIYVDYLERFIDSSTKDDLMNFPDLETDKSDQSVWVLKCPQRVSLAWHELPSSSSSSSSGAVTVAKLIKSIDLTLPNLQHEFTMEMVGSDIWNISKLYSINKTRDFLGPLSIFSSTTKGKMAVEGTVTQKLNMNPNCSSKEYGKICRERYHQYVTKPHQHRKHVGTQFLDRAPLTKPAIVKKKKLTPREKRTRGDRSEVEAKVFELFERQPNWTVKQLLQETNQPMLFMRELLKDLCVYNARDRTYELKPEYKNTSKEDITDSQ
ncbi:unnamed protein product [Cochlearia groenlandica]